jgi:hypothetical protein
MRHTSDLDGKGQGLGFADPARLQFMGALCDEVVVTVTMTDMQTGSPCDPSHSQCHHNSLTDHQVTCRPLHFVSARDLGTTLCELDFLCRALLL